MDRADIAREPSRPSRYSLIFRSGRTGFEYSAGSPFEGCSEIVPLMQEPTDGVQRQAGAAFRLGNGQLVIARPGGRTLRYGRAA